MAEIQGAGGDGAEGTRGVIDQISRTGRSTVVRSIDCDPSQRLTPAEAVGIMRGGGRRRSCQSSSERKERGERDESPVDLTKPPGRVRSGGPAPTGGLGPTGGAKLISGAGEIFNQF
jgi:hypothetical protein